MWSKDQSSTTTVVKAWSINIVGLKLYKLVKKINKTKNALKSWNRSEFGHYEAQI